MSTRFKAVALVALLLLLSPGAIFARGLLSLGAVGVSAGGIWRGSFIADGEVEPVEGIISEDGRLQLQGDGAGIFGTVATSGQQLSGEFEVATEEDEAFDDGSVRGAGSLVGTVRARERLSGTFDLRTSRGNRTRGTFVLDYDPLYERPGDPRRVAGAYVDRDTGLDKLVVNLAGRSTGTLFESNCRLTGNLAPVDPRFNAYAFNYLVSACIGDEAPLNGRRMKGLAAQVDGFAEGDSLRGYGIVRAGGGQILIAEGDFVREGPGATREVLTRHADSGRWRIYSLAGHEAVGMASLPLPSNRAFEAVSRADFNADNNPDVLLRDVSGARGGRWRLYTMLDTAILDGGDIDLPRDPAWQIVADADLNADGRADLLMRHDDGHWQAFLLDGRTILGEQTIMDGRTIRDDATLDLPTGDRWVVAGVSDLDADGIIDVILRSERGADAGDWRVCLIDLFAGTRCGGSGLFSKTSWRPVSTADFSGDFRGDILLRRGDGRWALQQMSGHRAMAAEFPDLPDSNRWSLAATADFSGDDFADLLLRRDDGRHRLFVMSGAAIVASGRPALPTDPAFRLVRSVDANRDGRADLLYRHEDGRYRLYLMDGTERIAKYEVTLKQPAEWTFVEPLSGTLID